VRSAPAERINARLEVAKAKGVKLGRKKGDRPGKRIVVKPEQEAMAKRMHAKGTGVSKIARATGLSRSTIYTIIG
jgi:DNA invertase Pin-like site-specific DNA recombinase